MNLLDLVYAAFMPVILQSRAKIFPILMMNSLRTGDLLDHYRIEDLAAQSGMACIYRATDMRNGHTVAIKVPHFEVEADPLLFDRFKREEEIGKRLDHPGVMKVFENEDPSRVYMVMEWIEGRLLRHILTDEKKLHARPSHAPHDRNL